MSNLRLVVPILAGSILIAACGSDPPPPPDPEPPRETETPTQDPPRETPQNTGPTDAEIRQMQQAVVDRLEEMVFFEYDESDLTSDAEATLRAKLNPLRDNPELRIRIEGHADERGSTEYNLALASERAEAARDFLVGFGIAANRFEITSYGEERPLVNASNEAAWARNRRAEFVVTAGRDRIRVRD